MLFKKEIQKKLLSRIVVSSTGCWEWQGALAGSNDAYGVTFANNERWYTHRLSFTVFKKKIPEGLKVCHKCDNPKCLNPEHLFLGTQQDNIDDCISKGRKTVHDAPNRVLTEAQAKEIKQFLSENYPTINVTAIAKHFNVTYIVVYNILKGIHYKNI